MTVMSYPTHKKQINILNSTHQNLSKLTGAFKSKYEQYFC